MELAPPNLCGGLAGAARGLPNDWTRIPLQAPLRDAFGTTVRVENDAIDLDPALRDAVVLDLPFSPLCRDDCAGLCPVCGANLNDDPSHSHDEPMDPRWEKLADLAGTDNE